MLSAAWWAAKWLGVRDAAGRWLNGSAVAAIAIAVTAIVLVVGIALLWHGIHAGAIEGANARWEQRVAESARANAVRDAEANRRAEDAAARERERLYDQLREAGDHAEALEAELARVKAAGGNPVIYPKSLSREMRK